MVAERDLNNALGPMVRGVDEILRRATPLDSAVRASAGSDPDSARVRALHERFRADGYREMVEVLRGKWPLRNGLSLERATHLLLLYLGMDVYRVLVDDFGWTHDDWITWTVGTLEEQVFTPSASAHGRRPRIER